MTNITTRNNKIQTTLNKIQARGVEMKYLRLYTQYMADQNKPAYDQAQVKKMYEALFDGKEIVNFAKFQYTALRAPFNTHEVFTKKGYAIFHQNLLDVGADVADHIKQYFFTGFLDDATAFEYAVPNTAFRTQLIADGITTLQEMIDKTGDYTTARNLSLGGALVDCNLNWFVGLTNWLLVERNDFTGIVPAELGNLSNLIYLRLDRNNLEGAIPAKLGNMQSLEIYWLHINNLTSYEKNAIATTQTVLNDIRFDSQGSTATNTGLTTESIDQIILDVRDMLIANPANTGGILELHQNFPHSGSQEILDAIAFISDPVLDGGMAWSINVEYPV